jgi:hypothetical protein
MRRMRYSHRILKVKPREKVSPGDPGRRWEEEIPAGG